MFRLAELSVGSVGGFCLFSESLRFVFGLLVPSGVEARGLAADRAVAIAVLVVELEGLLEYLGETAGSVGVGPCDLLLRLGRLSQGLDGFGDWVRAWAFTSSSHGHLHPAKDTRREPSNRQPISHITVATIWPWLRPLSWTSNPLGDSEGKRHPPAGGTNFPMIPVCEEVLSSSCRLH